jgi:hypothetical protein
MDKLEYGWWERKRGNVMIPPYVGDKRNYTLTLEELEKYHALLLEMKETITNEQEKVRVNFKAVRDGRIMSWDTPPRCTGLAHVLEFQVRIARNKLSLMQFLVDSTGQRVKEKRDGVSGLAQDVRLGQDHN